MAAEKDLEEDQDDEEDVEGEPDDLDEEVADF